MEIDTKVEKTGHHTHQTSNPCDFFLWGYLKDKIYRNRPRTIQELKEAITSEINGIDRDTLNGLMENFEKRLHATVEVEGRHFEQFLH